MTMKRTTRYLLRLDDLCPTWNRLRWDRVLEMVFAHGVRPILGVVPENEDPDLIRGPVDPEFWPRMRALQADGATIALHGYRHLSEQRGGGLLPLHKWTEFAGTPLEAQRHWIQMGMEKLRSEGLSPKLWIAPRHGLNDATLKALRMENIRVLSDGLAREPFQRGGVLWLPQQLWAPVAKGPGTWTLCLHPNTATDAEVDALEVFLCAHRDEFCSFSEVLELYPHAQSYNLWLALRQWCMLARIRVAKARKRRRTMSQRA